MIVNGNFVSCSTKFVVEGKKLTRPALPQLNLIVKTFDIGKWDYKSATSKSTYLRFIFPSATENRKFKIKIGKVTDNAILQKIQKGDYSGITDLLAYAKKTNAIYIADLTTTEYDCYKSNETLFDGRKLLQSKAYYYIYVKFDDENGKYYPIEGVTLGQAYFSGNSSTWWLNAYTSKDFKWNNLSSTYTSTNKKDDTTSSSNNNNPDKKKDDTIADVNLPNTGVSIAVAISAVTLAGTAVVLKIKKDKYKGI